jgi:hypothetical protein
MHRITLMKATDFLNSHFFKGEDMDSNLRIETSFVSLREREFVDGETKLVGYTDYEGGKGVVFNQTRLKACISAWGPNTDNWIGKPLVIRRGETEYAGRKTACVEIEPVVADRIAASPRAPISITSGRRMPPTPPEPPIDNGRGQLDDDIPF